MFLHNLKYEILTSIRAKDLIIWLMIFPIVLGTFFKIAFGSIYEKDTVFNTIPTAVVENQKSEVFHSVIDELEASDNPLLKVTYMSEDDAMKALQNDEVEGILVVDDKLSVKVKSSGITQTILRRFAERYMAQESIIKDTMESNPAGLQQVTAVLSQDMTVNENRPMTDGNTDPFTSYMYNLIAMVAMFGCITGLHVATNNQANLSDLGARRNCSPTPKIITIAANLVGSFFVQGICVAISVTFEASVLGIDFGPRLPLVYLGGICGGIMGVSFGFLIGSISSWSENTKVGLLMGTTMILCTLSGLMSGDLKAVIMLNVPIVNNLNPAAVITDSFYYLNVDADLGRYFIKLLTILAFSVVFMIGGFLLTRRKKYASL